MSDFSFLIHLSQTAFLVTILASIPAVLTAAVIGVAVALVQALTQLQDQTLSFAIKLIAVFIVILITAPWVSSYIVDYTNRVFQEALENEH